MKNTKKILAGLTALTLTAGFTACSGDNSGSGADTTTAEVTTTTKATVAVNTEGLKEGEEEKVEGAMAQLRDVELENKEVKWMGHYNINPGGNGSSEKPELIMFREKYGGYVTWVETTYENRYNDLSTKVLGGEGIDLFASDLANLPRGIISGMFESVDDYIDLNSTIWQNTKDAMELFQFGGKHYMYVTNIRSTYQFWYNTATIEANGLEDPWDLYKKGEWNWDSFKAMLNDFVDEESDQYGLDGWYNSRCLLYSAGVPAVSKDSAGNIVCNINDPTVEKAENYIYSLWQDGFAYYGEKTSWANNCHYVGIGQELGYFDGYWACEGDPSTWMSQIPAENVGIAPVPSPAGSDPWQAATTEGYVQCKGAVNPQGAALLAECTIVAGHDQGTIDVQNRKIIDDNHWDPELIDRMNEINSLALKYPVIEYATGVSQDVGDYLWDSAACMGQAFNGKEWATTREEFADALIGLVNEENEKLQQKVAE